MNLRRKTLLIMTFMPIIMILITYIFAQFILLDNYAVLEQQRAEVNVKRSLNALSNELFELSTIVADWAAWDDTYAFIEDTNYEYIESNLVDATFANLRLNVMLFINSTSGIVYCSIQ